MQVSKITQIAKLVALVNPSRFYACLLATTIFSLLPSVAAAQVEFTKPTWKNVNRSKPVIESQPKNDSAVTAEKTNSTLREVDASPKPIVTRQTAFGIPFSVGNNTSPVREVQLHVSTDQGKSWALYGRQMPTGREFPFRASADGQYYFAVQTVGSTIEQKELQPELIIVIDSKRPVLNVNLKTDSLGRMVVGWAATDPNLKPESIQIAYQTVPGWGRPSPNWTPVELPKPDGAIETVFQDQISFYPKTHNAMINLRISIEDKAGNSTILFRRHNLPRTAMTIQRDPKIAFNRAVRTQGAGQTQLADRSSASRPPGTDPYSHVSQNEKDAAAEGIGTRQAFDLASSSTQKGNAVASTEMREGWRVMGNSAFRQDFAANSPNEAEFVEPPSRNGSNNFNKVDDPNFRRPNLGNSSFASSQTQTTEEAFRQGSNLNRIPDGEYAKLSRSRRFELDYQVDQIQPDDISKLEIWITDDGANTWRLHTTDSDKQSPVQVEVDDDGVYGYRIRVKTVDGLESVQPSKGDAADVWVEVDTTKPSVELTSVPYGRRQDAGKLLINWRATDKRLAAKPITLYYSVNIDGPWQILVEKLPNTGQFKWPVTNRIPRKVFLRIEAIDAAGNRNIHQTSQPIDLSGLNPRGMIRSVRPLD